MSSNEQSVSAVSREIMRYFTEHPQAADTAEWIGRWWLQGRRLDDSEKNVQAALDRLVEAGLVERHESPGKPPLYARANRTS